MDYCLQSAYGHAGESKRETREAVKILQHSQRSLNIYLCICNAIMVNDYQIIVRTYMSMYGSLQETSFLPSAQLTPLGYVQIFPDRNVQYFLTDLQPTGKI
jgi:hypothetical protein